MDPLSITASVITLIQITHDVLSYCSNYAAAAKGAPWALSKVKRELRDLSDALESVALLSRRGDDTDSAAKSQLQRLQALCDSEDGPIFEELKNLEEKLRPPRWASKDGSRRKAFVESLTWPLKEQETEKCLSNIERLKSTVELALQTDQTAVTMDIRETQRSMISTEQFQKVLQWLSAPDPSVNHNAASKKKHPDTGLWFLQSQTFKDWNSASKPFLWLHGIPGCGKSVLSSTALDSLLEENHTDTIAYFYFDFNDSMKQSLDQMLRSLIVQLSSSQKTVPQPLDTLFNACDKGQKQPKTQDLEDLLPLLIEMHEATAIVLDALDECEDQEELLQFIERLNHLHSVKKLRMILTSRKLKNFEDFFENNLHGLSELSIQNDKVDKDIRTYVRGRLHSDQRFKRWRQQPEVQKEIENKLAENSGGMFRWAACQMDALSGCRSLSKLRIALDSLPETLDETYERILDEIDESDRKEVLRVLQWLTYSRRPLSVDEVAEIVAFETSDDSVAFNKDNRLPEPEEILDICSSLVITVDAKGKSTKQMQQCSDRFLYPDTEWSLDSNLRLVRLAHFSVKEFLLSDRIHTGSAAFFSINERVAHDVIAKTCLSCLLQYEPSEKLAGQFPLTSYAIRHWNVHLYFGRNPSTLELGEALFSSEDKLRNWINLFDFDKQFYTPSGIMVQTCGSPLYYAVLTDLIDLVERMIQSNTSTSRKEFVNMQGGVLDTPLQAASFFGSEDIVTLLLENGADPNIYGGAFKSALGAAAQTGSHEITKLLLDSGAHIHEDLPIAVVQAAQN